MQEVILQSTTATFWLNFFDNAVARLRTQVVFPTPPLPETTEIILGK